MSAEKIFFIPDTHRPYHDTKAVALANRAMKVFQPDKIVILGDYADCYSVSSHSKNPNRIRDLKDELSDVQDGLREINKIAPNALKYYVAGNHEDRLERYLMEKAPELFNSVTIPGVLGLAELGWNYTPYKRSLKIGKLNITHDTGNAGPYAHYRAQEAFQGNVIIGHTHRLGYAVVGNAAGKPHVGAMFGWLGDFDQVDYMHQIKARRDWAHGFGVGYREANGNVHLIPVPIVDGAVVIDGRVVR